MLKLHVGCSVQTIKQFNFPAGEVGVQIMECGSSERVVVSAYIKNSDDLVALLMLSDAIDRKYGSCEKILNLPYVPYARQDRVCNEGESLSISVFANMINSCNWSKVKILDPHSDVTPALIKNCVVTESHEVFKKQLNDFYVVAPDAGAYKKAYKWAQKKNAKGVLCANKVRDVRNGNILSVSLDNIPENANLLVVDDICDGGRTFTEVAKVVKGHSKLQLFVTHGIFTKGIDQLTEVYDHIYTTNSYHGEVPENLKHSKITWISV